MGHPRGELGIRNVLTVLRMAWREHGLAFTALAVHAALAAAALTLGWAPVRRQFWHPGYTMILVKAAIFWLPILAAVELWRARQLPRATAILSFRRRYLNPVTIIGVPLSALFFAHSALIHDSWKGLLGVVTPYAWDARLAQVDVWLHGTDPWRLTHAVFGSARATWLIDWAYWLWYPFLWVAFAWTAWTHRRRLRSRILVTWALSWILLGTVVAHGLASGGPVFYGHLVTGPDPFADLVARLQLIDATMPLHAIALQRGVWANTEAGGGAFWISMSAMPSLHVATPVIFALAWMKVSPWLGAAMWAAVAVTLLGSVHLGWHYAVDGYVSILTVVGIWWLTDRLITGWPNIEVPRSEGQVTSPE
jgi:hypothetical protein